MKKNGKRLVIEPKAIEQPIEIIKTVEPKPRGFTPRPCSACEALRPKGVSYSRVYAKHGDVRYCKCTFCGNTWTQYFGGVTTAIVSEDMKADCVSVVCTHGISGDSSSSD